MSDAPVPIDLRRFADTIAGAREFLRGWMRPDGRTAWFVSPVPVGPDPADFGATLVDAVEQAAQAYARAVSITADEARARLWQGIEAARASPPPAGPPPPSRRGASIIEFVPKQDPL